MILLFISINNTSQHGGVTYHLNWEIVLKWQSPSSSLKSDDSRATGKPTQSLIWNIFWSCSNFLPHLFSHWPIINLLENPTWIDCLFPPHHQCLFVTSYLNTIFWLVVSNLCMDQEELCHPMTSPVIYLQKANNHSIFRGRVIKVTLTHTLAKIRIKKLCCKISILYLIYDVLNT